MPTVALICTEGFADVLTLGRQNRADPYATHVGPSPWERLLPSPWRVELAARVDANGQELVAPDLAALDAAIAALPSVPDTFAVSLLHGHAHPAHEQQVKAHLQRRYARSKPVCSHERSLPETAGEFEWAVATLAAAGIVAPPAAGTQDGPAQAAVAVAEPWAAFAQALEGLSNAMQARLVELAVSSVVREAMDCAAAVFLPDGRMVAQAKSLPLLLGSLSPAVQGILKVCPAASMQPVDGYLSNDPWSGCTHLPDFVLVRPVFTAGRLRALVACILHHQDIGGIAPGSLPTNATSIHEEGLRIPPVRLFAQGRLDESLAAMLQANSRMPDNLRGDLGAQWQALEWGDAALQEFIGDNDAVFEPLAEATLQAAAGATRNALRAAPDGDYHFADALDGDGLSLAPVAVDVVLQKRGDALTIDLSACAGQARGPINASQGAVWAAVTYFARMLAPAAPSNGGCTARIILVTRAGSIVDPAPGAAVNARTNLVKMLANALLGAWAQAMPQQMPAPNAGVAVVLNLSGEVDGKRWMFTEIIASAAGGAPWGAGGSGVSTDVGNARNTPAEAIERQAPIRVERVTLHRGSGGAGRHAGGCGVTRAYRLLGGDALISYRGERHTIAAQGAAGGAPGRNGSAWIERTGGKRVVLDAKARAEWHVGDLLVIQTAGAGGWGPPA